VTGDWRRLHKREELHNFHASTMKSKRMKQVGGGAGVKHGKDEKCLENFGRKT
jgi:hypothetical protein